MSRDLENYKS